MEGNVKEQIINSLFTKKELEELKFTEEELDDLVEAELISQSADLIPNTEKELVAFYQKLDALFPANLPIEEAWKRYVDLQNTDPKFLTQFVALSALIDTVEEVPPATTEKINLSDIAAEKDSIVNEERAQKLARVKALVEGLKD